MSTDLWNSDEPRYAEVAREMVESGNYIQPYFNGEPYTEKPPLFFWTVAVGAKLFGSVNQLAVRLPSVLSALGILALIIAFVSEHFDRRKAFLSAIILCISPQFFMLARHGQIDMLLTFLITASLVSFYKWYARGSCGYLIIFYLCMALATLSKGPIGILLPFMVVVCFLLFRKEWGKINKMRLYFGLPIAIAIVLAWYIPATQQSAGYDFGPMVKRQIVGRMFHPSSHSVSVFYWPFSQLASLAKGMVPWTFLIPPTIVMAYRSRRCAPSFFLFCWASVIFAFFTIIASKRDLYILPMYPAIATLIALWVLRPTPTFNLRLIKIMSAFMGVFVLVIAAIAPVYLKHRFPDLTHYYSWNTTVPMVMAGIAAVAVAIFGRKREHVIGVLVGTILVVFTITAVSILPRMNEYKSARSICDVYNSVKTSDSEIAMLSSVREEYIFYTKSVIKTVYNIGDLKQFFDSENRMFCLSTEKNFKRYLNKRDFPVYIVAKKRVSSRIIMLLCNQDVVLEEDGREI